MKKIVVIFLLLVIGARFIWNSRKEESVTSSMESVTKQDSSGIDWSKAGPDARRYRISFEAVRDAVANGAKFYDVRDVLDYQLGNFGITENLPLPKLEAGNLPDVDKSVPIYIHCKAGIRSAKATQLLREAGFKHVFDLSGIEEVEAIGGKLK